MAESTRAGPQSYEGFVRKASRAARAAVLKHRYLMQGTRYGEEMARVVAKEVRDALTK